MMCLLQEMKGCSAYQTVMDPDARTKSVMSRVRRSETAVRILTGIHFTCL